LKAVFASSDHGSRIAEHREGEKRERERERDDCMKNQTVVSSATDLPKEPESGQFGSPSTPLCIIANYATEASLALPATVKECVVRGHEVTCGLILAEGEGQGVEEARPR
jgi:hypothetical protein